jgi:hypothetical protein
VIELAVPASTRPSSASNRAAIISGIGLGIIQAATPLVFWWLDGFARLLWRASAPVRSQARSSRRPR